MSRQKAKLYLTGERAMLLEIVAVVAVALFGLLTFAAVPVLLRLREILNESQLLLVYIRQEIVPLAARLNRTLNRFDEVANTARISIERLGVLFRAAEELGRQIDQVRTLMRGGQQTVSVNIQGLWAGARAASQVIWQHLKPWGGSNGR